MENILKKQTPNQINEDLKKILDPNFNYEEYVPNFYENTIELFKEDIKTLEELCSSDNTKVIFINKLTLRDNKITNEEEFKQFIYKRFFNTTDIKGKFTYEIDRQYYKVKTAIGGLCFKTDFTDEKTGKKTILKTILGNAYRNPFDTMHTIFHEFCHGLQDKGEYNEKNLKENYINYSYLHEAEADLFGHFVLLTKALATNNEDIINDTIEQSKNLILSMTPRAIFDGYFGYPILKDYLENKEKLNELKNYIKEDCRINFSELKKYTFKLINEKAEEYKKDEIFENIDDKIFSMRESNRNEIIKEFLENNKNNKDKECSFVKDCIEYKGQIESYKSKEPDKIFLLEDNICWYAQNKYYYNNMLRKSEYWEKTKENYSVKDYKEGRLEIDKKLNSMKEKIKEQENKIKEILGIKSSENTHVEKYTNKKRTEEQKNNTIVRN